MKLNLSCSDYTFPLLPHRDVINLISMLGFHGIDIGLFGGRSHIRPEQAFSNINSIANDLKAKVSDKGLEIATICFIPLDLDFLSLATNNPDIRQRQKARDLFLRVLEFTVSCDAKHITTGPGVKWESESYETSINRDGVEMAWRVEQAKSVGVTVAFEPHANSIAGTPKAALHLIELATDLTIALDYAHFVRYGIPESEVEPLIDFTSHFHARCACNGRLQTSFNENTIDFARILSKMRSLGYKQYVTLEYVWTEWEQCNEVDNISETILLRDYLLSL